MKINIKNQIKTLSFSFFVIIGLPILFVTLGDEFNISFIVLMMVSLILPTYLYLEYLYFSKGTEIQLDYCNNNIVIIKNNEVEIINFKNILLIEKHCSFPIAENRIQWLPTDEFLFFQLTFDNGRTEIIPCFITFDLYIPLVKSEVKKKFIPSILVYFIMK